MVSVGGRGIGLKNCIVLEDVDSEDRISSGIEERKMD